MKLSATLMAMGAALSMAQSVDDLSTCGKTCVSNMLNIAVTSFGCKQGDVACYCSHQDFFNGIRDCSNEVCTSGDDAAKAIAFGTNLCKNAVSSASGAVSSLTSGLSDKPTPTGTDSVAVSSTPITTTPLVATVTSGGSTFVTTTGSTTIYGFLTSGGSAASSAADSASSAASSAAESASSGAASASSAASSAAASASSRASSVANSASRAASSAASSAAASATQQTGAAPMMTGVPALAGAAMAALLFV
jgi:hypothetical protein